MTNLIKGIIGSFDLLNNVYFDRICVLTVCSLIGLVTVKWLNSNFKETDLPYRGKVDLNHRSG